MILMKTRANGLADVRQLNFWGFELKDVTIFGSMPNIEVASLSVNQIRSLDAFTRCQKLKELHLRNNKIASFEELKYLAGLSNLRHLALLENPIAEDPDYRRKVIARLPQLTVLDSTPVTDMDMISSGIARPARMSVAEEPRKLANMKLPVNQAKAKSWRTIPRPEMEGPEQDAALAAILALLPSLSDDSLKVVLRSIADMVQ
jgi:hypothetical protein